MIYRWKVIYNRREQIIFGLLYNQKIHNKVIIGFMLNNHKVIYPCFSLGTENKCQLLSQQIMRKIFDSISNQIYTHIQKSKGLRFSTVQVIYVDGGYSKFGVFKFVFWFPLLFHISWGRGVNNLVDFDR